MSALSKNPTEISRAYNSRLLWHLRWVFFLLLGVAWVLVGFYTWDRVREQETSNLRILSVALANSTGQTFANVRSSLDLLATALEKMDPQQSPIADSLLKNYLKAQPLIRYAALQNSEGKIFLYSHSVVHRSFSDHKNIFAQHSIFYPVSPNFCVGSLIPGIKKGEWFIPFRRQVKLVNNKKIFVLVLLPLQDGALSAWLGYPLHSGTALFLIRRDGYLEARHPAPDKTSFTVRQKGIAAHFVAAHPHMSGGNYLGYSTAVGEWRLGAVQDVHGFPLIAGASILRSTVWSLWARSMIGPSVVIVFLFLLGFMGFRSVRRAIDLRENLRHDYETRVWEAKERAEVTLASIGDAVITTDTLARVTGANSVAEMLLGCSLEEMRNKPLDSVFRIINEITREPVFNPVHRVLEKGQIVGLANHTTLISADNQEYAIEDSAAPIRSRNGDVLGVVLVFHDVSERRKLADELLYQANHDVLTRLPNRMSFQNYLQNACQSEKKETHRFYVAILDLDGFKQINDLFGHENGDVLLCELASRIPNILGKENIIARLGGDEFGMIFFTSLQRLELDTLIRRVLSTISEPVEVLGSMVTVSATIGLSCYPADADSPSQLLRLADLAMYAAKSAGRNGFLFYNADLEASQQKIAEGIRRAEQALTEKLFVLVYQPLVELHGKVLGMEALLRINLGNNQLLSPDAFASALDHPLLARKIGQLVLEMAINQGLLWWQQGLSLRMCINISARHLLDVAFLADMHEIMSRYPDFPPDMIELEVTESAPMLDLPAATAALKAVNAMGIRVALDDFGTGNASLTYLQKLPAQSIKIDQSFVRDILIDTKDLAIVAGVSSTAQALGIEVIAEGVESLEHAWKLEGLGVDVLQGYAISKPLVALDVPGWIAGYKPILSLA